MTGDVLPSIFLSGSQPQSRNPSTMLHFPGSASHRPSNHGTRFAGQTVAFCAESETTPLVFHVVFENVMRRLHIALGVSDIEASVDDYSGRLGCGPTLIVPDEYALWRTDTINFSIRKVVPDEVGQLRHLGWEDSSSSEFSAERDVNGILWEKFSPEQQAQEIRHTWPDLDHHTQRSDPELALRDLRPDP